MNKEVIFVESEFAQALNKIDRHTEFLAEAIQKYNTVLAAMVLDRSIKDVFTTKELEDIQESLGNIKTDLINNNTELKNTVSSMTKAMADVDNFSFPEGMFDPIASLLRGFMS